MSVPAAPGEVSASRARSAFSVSELWWFPAVAFVGIAAVLVVVAWVSVAHLGLSSVPRSTGPRWRGFPHQPWLDGWARFDSGWYASIARHGYARTPRLHGQSAVAYFPGYPLLMRAMAVATGDVLLAGILVTFACGLAASITFFCWCRERLGGLTAQYAIVALLVYPFAYYLVGAVYGDATFVLAALLAFVFLEHDHPVLAGLAGAAATATRPVGAALVLGLVVRTLERRGALGPGLRVRLRSLAARDYAVLVSAGGLVAYGGFLWYRFGDPLAFNSAMEGWKQPAGVSTWLKFDVFRAFAHPFSSPYLARSLMHATLTVAALALVPRVVRRLGWGYGVYVFSIVFFPALATKDFVGMARYVLAAFPLFAVAGEWLAQHPRPARLVLGTSALMLVLSTSLYSRWYYLS